MALKIILHPLRNRIVDKSGLDDKCLSHHNLLHVWRFHADSSSFILIYLIMLTSFKSVFYI